MRTKKQARGDLLYLRGLVAQVGKAISDDDYAELEELLNEVDGTSALLREYVEDNR